MGAGGKIGMKLMSVAIGIPVSMATRKVVERVWLAARPEDPPRKPTEADIAWQDALAWAALSAVGIVLADIVTRRTAETAFRAITGIEPPPGKPAKGSRKLAKAMAKSKVTADD